MLVREQLEPMPTGKVISDGKVIDDPPVPGTLAGPLRLVCTSLGGREAQAENAGKGSWFCLPAAKDGPW